MRSGLEVPQLVDGPRVAEKLVKAMQKGFADLEQQPGMGSPRLGQELGVPELRTWDISGFPLAIWYFERGDVVDVVRIVGTAQDPPGIAI